MSTDDKLLLEKNKGACSWLATYGIIPHLAQSISAKKIVEIGVAYGYHADFICTTLPEVTYVGVDPYKANYDLNDIFCDDVKKLFKENDSQRAMDRLFATVSDNLKAFNSRATIKRGLSWEIADQIDDGSVDLVYIDGDHTYEAVLKDLNAWVPKIKKGGIVCGDDIGWPGVKKAVDEFFLKDQKNYQLISKNGFENLPVFFAICDGDK
jgi:predicted O-methyltransferase YrrM